jgi:hypothetical protein
VRPCYRARQLWLALVARPTPAELANAQAVLLPAQMVLFNGMQPSEQAHALHMLKALRAQGETNHDLLAAALLHDAGKQRCPLHAWERALIVLVQAASPALARRWGQTVTNECTGWQKPFIVAARHAEWGAEMALQAGASPTAVALIRYHAQPAPAGSESVEESLLRKLQAVDQKS